MHISIFFRRLRRCMWSVGLGTATFLNLNGQAPSTPQISWTQSGNNYTFHTSNLGAQDLVFYRFSDGFHQINQSGISATASVTRQFKTGGVQTANAYVVRKGGPILRAQSVQVTPAPCGNCTPPYVGLSGNQYLQMAYTWMPFTNTLGLNTYLDNSTTPDFTTPNEPWFFLIVTMRPPQDAQTARINIPAPFSCQGVIYQNNWVSGFSTFNQNPVGSISNTGQQVTVNFHKPGNDEFNLYLLLKGTPEMGASYELTSEMLDKTGVEITETSLQVQGKLNPHDPNILQARQITICPQAAETPRLKYRVTFQNTGHAPAGLVEVLVNFQGQHQNPGQLIPPEEIIDPSTVEILNVNPSWIELVSDYTLPGTVYFAFDGINLPGLYQSPTPNLASTIGWVEFSIKPNDCLTEGTLITNADVVFSWGENYNDYEIMATNSVTHNIILTSDCPETSETCNTFVGSNGERSSDAQSATFDFQCYPTPFNDHLNIEAPASGDNQPLKVVVSDITGKKWIEKNYATVTGHVQQYQLDTTPLPDGIYLAHFIQGTQTLVRKILKNRP